MGRKIQVSGRDFLVLEEAKADLFSFYLSFTFGFPFLLQSSPATFAISQTLEAF